MCIVYFLLSLVVAECIESCLTESTVDMLFSD